MIRAAWLRYRGRRIYQSMEQDQDSVDCGLALLREVSPRYYANEKRLLKIIDELRLLDKEEESDE